MNILILICAIKYLIGLCCIISSCYYAVYGIIVTNDYPNSLYIIVIPFYVYYLYECICFCIVISPDIIDLDICCSKVHVLNTLCNILNFSIYSGIFVITLYLLENYDPQNVSVNSMISRYLIFTAVYIFYQDFRYKIGSTFEIYIESNGNIRYGTKLDNGMDYDVIKKRKLRRVYLFERNEFGINLDFCNVKIDCTSLLNPIPIATGISLLYIANTITSNTNDLINILNLVSEIMNNAIIVNLCVIMICTIISAYFMCKYFGPDKTLMYITFVATIMLLWNNLDAFLLTKYYSGMGNFMDAKNSITINDDALRFVFFFTGAFMSYITRHMFLLITIKYVLRDICC